MGLDDALDRKDKYLIISLNMNAHLSNLCRHFDFAT